MNACAQMELPGLPGLTLLLETLGYTCGAFDIPACAVDAPHRRSRIWVVAYAYAIAGQGSGDTLGNAHRKRQPQPGWPFSEQRQRSGDSDALDDHWRGADWLDCADGKARRIPPAESGVRPLAHGVPDRLARLKAVGNAVVPQIVTALGLAIMATLEEVRDARPD